MRPLASTPCPMILQPQCAQVGATAWIAHSKLSKVSVEPAIVTSKLLSYSFPQTSHRPMFEPSFRTVEFEYPEVVAHHRNRHVEHRDGADVSLEGPGVPVAVHHEIRRVIRDRASEAVAAEKGEDPARLALECRHGGRIVQQHDTNGAVCDRLQAALDRGHLFGRLGVHAPKKRLAEIRQR